MKKQILLALCALLASCTETSESSTVEPESGNTSLSESSPSDSVESVIPEKNLGEVLLEYKNGYKMESHVEEKYNDVTKTYDVGAQSKGDKLTVISKTGEMVNSSETYYRSENGGVNTARLNFSNTLTYYPLYNAAIGDYFSFDNDGFKNLFADLEESDFVKNGDSYSLSIADKTSAYNSIACHIYSNPGLNLDSFSLTIEADSLSYEATMSFTGTTNYSYTASGTITALGEDEAIEEVRKPFEEVNDPVFEEKINSLKAGNFTMTVENYQDDTLLSTSIYKASNQAVSYSIEEDGIVSEYAYAVGPDGLLYEAVKDGDKYLASSEGSEESLDDYLKPSFAISRACFSQIASGYALLDGVEGDMSAFCPLYVEADTASDLTIAFNENSIVVENVLGSYKTILTYTDISTTTTVSYADFVFDTAATYFAEVLDEAALSKLSALLPAEEINALPLPIGYQENLWVDMSEEGYLLLAYADDTNTVADADISAYKDVLIGLGYTLDANLSGENAFFLYKNVTISGAQKKTYIYPVAYEGLFTIMICDESTLAEL